MFRETPTKETSLVVEVQQVIDKALLLRGGAREEEVHAGGRVEEDRPEEKGKENVGVCIRV